MDLRQDGTGFVDARPRVLDGSQLVNVGEDTPDGILITDLAGRSGYKRVFTVDYIATNQGQAPIFFISESNGPRHLMTDRVAALGIIVDFHGTNTFDYDRETAIWAAKAAAVEAINSDLRTALFYGARGNKAAEAVWRYEAYNPGMAMTARWEGFKKQAYNDLVGVAELTYNAANTTLRMQTGLSGPELHIKRATILPQEQTGATTFTATKEAVLAVVPAAAPEVMAARVTAGIYTKAPVLVRTGGAANSVDDVVRLTPQQVKAKIIGTAQQTGNDGAHAFKSYREAILLARNPEVEAVYLNKGYNAGLELAPKTISPNRRPDVLGRYFDGRIDRVEVFSKTDNELTLTLRNTFLDPQIRAQGFTPLPPRVVFPVRM
jgi:hypothetical protein